LITSGQRLVVKIGSALVVDTDEAGPRKQWLAGMAADVASLRSRGVGVIVVSSDIEEILGLAHRVLVVRAGRIVAELAGDRMTEENILVAAFAETGANHEQKAAQVTR